MILPTGMLHEQEICRKTHWRPTLLDGLRSERAALFRSLAAVLTDGRKWMKPLDLQNVNDIQDKDTDDHHSATPHRPKRCRKINDALLTKEKRA